MTSNLNKHFRDHEALKSTENKEQIITNTEKENDDGNDILNDAFGPDDQQINESLSKTIELQIESLNSPDKTPPAKYPRIILRRIQVDGSESREKGGTRGKSGSRGKGATLGENSTTKSSIGDRTRRRKNNSGKNQTESISEC